MSLKPAALVSVIVPTYNYARFLGAMLESAFAQSYRNTEVIVVDDGSTDNTVEVLRNFLSDQRLKVHAQSNQGCIPAMNNGFRVSTGEFIAFCGSDDLWNRDHLQRLMDGFAQHPEAGLIYDNGAYFNDRNGEDEGLVIPREVAEKLTARPNTLEDVFKKNWITNCTFLVRRQVLEQTGLFDPNVYMTGDLHLIYRIAARWPIYFVDYVGARIRMHGNNMTHVNRHYEYGVKCLEDIRDNHPAVYEKIDRRLFNRKLGRKYFRQGRYYERIGRFADAEEAYGKAIGCRIGRPQYYWRYLWASCRRVLGSQVREGQHPGHSRG